HRTAGWSLHLWDMSSLLAVGVPRRAAPAQPHDRGSVCRLATRSNDGTVTNCEPSRAPSQPGATVVCRPARTAADGRPRLRGRFRGTTDLREPGVRRAAPR